MSITTLPGGVLCRWLAMAAMASSIVFPAGAAVQMYGDPDALGTGGSYPSDPTAGATLQGLAPGATTASSLGPIFHPFAGAPGIGDFAGTDQVYVGSNQTGFRDGYSTLAVRLAGPQVLTLDFSSLVPGGSVLTSLTLGIAADDFQAPSFGQPFVATLNGAAAPALTALLNSIDQGGPAVQFFTIGLDPSLDNGSHILTLAIDQGGDGGDGWAVDFLTIGVTTRVAGGNLPEPGGLALAGLALALVAVVLRLRRRRR